MPSSKRGSSALAGAVSGQLGSFIFQPFDVVKTRLINAPTRQGAIGMTRQIIAEEGVTALWRASVPTAARLAVGGAAFFSVQSAVLATLGSTTSATMLAGAIGRGTALMIAHPLNVVKTRIEGNRVRQYTGIFNALKVIGRTEGFGGLYSGFIPSAMRDVPYAALQVLFYTRIKAAAIATTGHTSSHPVVQLIAGGTAAASATLVTHPFDVIRTRVQMNTTRYEVKDLPTSGRITKTVRYIYQEGGAAGFFRGVSPRVIKKFMGSALTWMTYEQVVQFLHGETHL